MDSNLKSLQKQILQLLKNKNTGYSVKELSRALKITKRNYHSYRKAIESLRSSGRLLKLKSTKKYIIASKSRVIKGELSISKSGFGFVNDEENDVDIFIGRDHLNTAFDGDMVEVKLFASYRGKNEEGYVSKILQRKRNNFVGTFHQTQYYGYVVPDNPKVYRDFFIANEKQKSAQNGQKVVVSLDKWETDHLNPEGTIKEIIGYPGEVGVDVASIAYSFQIDLNFPIEVEEEARKINYLIDDKEATRRLDLRDKVCFTIDPEDAKDFDDAISLESLPNGNYLLGVHIADVSFYVEENSSIDKEALKRSTSVYLVDRVIPMLPEKLSNSICSLQPNTDKLTFSCIMELSLEGEILSYKLLPSIINSKRRFTYEEVQKIVDTKFEDTYAPILSKMMMLSKSLTVKRFSEGGIDFETPEVSFSLDEKGFPREITRIKRLDSHRLVEEFMLLANKTVAQHIKKINSPEHISPFIYRVHEKPDPEKIEKFSVFLTALGYKTNPQKQITAKYLQNLLKTIKGSKEEIIIEEVALRSMMKAEYSTKNIGHFGLGFNDYTHFTSPIRRFPDLVVHRLLKRYITGQEYKDLPSQKNYLKKVCAQATRMERVALEAERESIRIKQNEYISQHIGEQFNGIISGVTSFGVFVELDDTLVEGLIHVKDLDDYYIHDEKSYALIGRDIDQILRLGDGIKIEVKDVNLEEGKVDFRLVEKII